MKDDAGVSFYIVGGGVNEEKLKIFAKEKELNNVTFVGMQPPEEVADLYAAADVNVIPLQKGLIYAALPSKTADCLIAGKSKRVVAHSHGEFVDFDIDEALAMKKDIDEYQYTISKNLAR